MGRKKNMSSNKVKIKQYLMTGKSLTRIQAIELKFGMDLSTRVSELRSDGIAISDEFIDKKKLQKRYFMTREDIEKNQSTERGE